MQCGMAVIPASIYENSVFLIVVHGNANLMFIWGGLFVIKTKSHHFSQRNIKLEIDVYSYNLTLPIFRFE